MNTKSQLVNLVNSILNEEATYHEQKESVWGFYELCSQISGLTAFSEKPEDLKPVMLETGKAISPTEAIKCLWDFCRTVKFMQGINSAIKAAQQVFSGKKITILYAGCGPFAPYALGMACKYLPSEIEFILLDIHLKALTTAQMLVEHFGLTPYIKDYTQEDAVKYKIPTDCEVHILITETMNRALTKEPHVAIVSNLVPQLHKEALLIPEQISVTAAVCNLRKEFVFGPPDASPEFFSYPPDFRERINPVTLMELNKNNFPLNLTGNTVAQGSETSYTFTIPEPFYKLMLFTFIKIFEDYTLGDYDSILTLPLRVKTKITEPEPVTLEFTYSMGNNPGFVYQGK